MVIFTSIISTHGLGDWQVHQMSNDLCGPNQRDQRHTTFSYSATAEKSTEGTTMNSVCLTILLNTADNIWNLPYSSDKRKNINL